MNKKGMVNWLGTIAIVISIIAGFLTIGQFFGVIDTPVGSTALSFLGGSP